MPEPTTIVPPLGPQPRLRRPSLAERVLDSGLHVIAVRRTGVPLVELRLRVPLAGTAASHPARTSLLSATMLTGTDRHDQVGLAEALGELGSGLSVSVDSDRLLVGGAVLRTGLGELLDLLAEILSGACYPAAEVAGERQRLLDRLAISRSQPAVLAREALRRRLFGDHPYAREMAELDAVAAVSPAQLRRLHGQRVVPDGATLTLVGDLSPARVLDQVTAALEGWGGPAGRRGPRPLPPVEPGPVLVVHRAGSVQSSLRLGGAAVPRDDPAYPALHLANLVFGGYFSSRLVENIREDKGYTYSPRSRIEHGAAGSSFLVDADVSTEVTAPALLEISYELGRMATLPVGQSELDDARQYAIGGLSLSTATQAGLASTLSTLAGVGLTADWLREHPVRLAKVTVPDVLEVSRRVFAPSGLVTVVLGDAGPVTGPMSSLGAVRRA
ncbi:MAG TPA: pitrilysin family protein [Mycobacteriales bacterium]|nr:pitrilysin family protein [Mycobacteriales bacterium]